MKKKYKNIEAVGILGLGSIGYRHAKNCLNKKVKVFGFDECDSKLKRALILNKEKGTGSWLTALPL